ncbi:hypothetical protein ZIOFF_044725 [Zingiber officinale]|uniref:GDT1 family protein n=1 Tax=Zingiber officinale TaxID=94328 RepID=A0A8J5KRF1_ZINOF|nr:hypothetical protein ZIOFF_044725 [Zingiber officinale]
MRCLSDLPLWSSALQTYAVSLICCSTYLPCCSGLPHCSSGLPLCRPVLPLCTMNKHIGAPRFELVLLLFMICASVLCFGQGLTKSLAMTVLSEIGDKTFFAAAVNFDALMVFRGNYEDWITSLCVAQTYRSIIVVMTILSASLGWAAPNLICSSVHFAISRKWSHHITTILFFGFGFWSLWEGFTEDGEAEELAEVEAKLSADWKAEGDSSKSNFKSDDLKKQQRPFLTQFFSPIFLKAFSITFFGEWGDKSQIATIGLASDANPLGVVLGGIIGQALCTTAAVLGGKSLASQISEKMRLLPSQNLVQQEQLGLVQFLKHWTISLELMMNVPVFLNSGPADFLDVKSGSERILLFHELDQSCF